MNVRERVGIFYSKGRHFPGILQQIRHTFPDAEITLIAPAGYRVSEAEHMLVNTVMMTESACYGGVGIRAFSRLIRTLRAKSFDCFIVIFDSPRLRILAGLSGARDRVLYTFDRRFQFIRANIFSTLIEVTIKTLVGHLVYLWIGFIVRFCHVHPKKNNGRS